MNKRYFAVGLKGWTQVRVAAKPPKATNSETIMNVKGRSLTWIPGDVINSQWRDGYYKCIEVPKKLKLKQTIYVGGRTIATIKSAQFRAILKANVQDGGMMELLPEQVEQLKAGIK